MTCKSVPVTDGTPDLNTGTQTLTWDERVAALWERAEEMHEEEVLAAVADLAAERPEGDPEALFERASAADFAGRDTDAVDLYRAALDAGLGEPWRAQAVVQLAGSLRSLGRAEEALGVLDTSEAGPQDEGGFADAAEALAALCLADLGRDREALVRAVGALARHAESYGPAIEAYLAELPASPGNGSP